MAQVTGSKSEQTILFYLCCRAARMIRASHQLQLDTGMLLAVPIPAAAAAEGAAIQQAIQESLREADEKGIRGAEVRKCEKIE